MSADCLVIRDEVVVIPDLIDAFDPGWAAKGNQRTFYVLEREFDLLLDRFR